MKLTAPIFVILILLSLGCEEEKVVIPENQSGESALTRREKIRELEADLEVAKWETVRLSLKYEKWMVPLW